MNKKNIKDIYPLSHIQSGILFSYLLHPNTDVYLNQTIFSINAPLKIDNMQLAWQEAMQRHTILRTGILWNKLEKPLQYVLTEVELPFHFEDWSHLDESAQQQLFDAYISADRRLNFDLTKAPLFRVTCFKYSDKKFNIIWSHHHIIIDGWSSAILLNEILEHYATLNSGEHYTPKYRNPYKNYIAWLNTKSLKTAEDFWREHLKDISCSANLSIKAKNFSQQYTNYETIIDNHLTFQIKQLARDHNVTLNTILQAAVGLMLKVYTNQDMPLLGITISGRSIELNGIEDMVGLFINTLPLKICTTPKEDLSSLLNNLQKQTNTFNLYSYSPLSKVQAWSGLNQSLFDTVLVFENYPLFAEGDSFTSIERTEFPLTINVIPGDNIKLIFRYQTTSFEHNQIQGLCAYLKNLLIHMVTFPHSCISDLSVLPNEQKNIIDSWSQRTNNPLNPPLLNQPFVAPTNQIEQYLCTIWMQTLNKEQIGIHDNYFALGGHSLLAIKIISNIREKFNIEIPLKSIFTHSTISDLSNYLSELLQTNAKQSISIPISERPEFIPLSFAQQRLWFLNQLLDNKALYNIPLVFDINGTINASALEQTINYLIIRHESLRTGFKLNNGDPYQFVLPQLHVKLTSESANTQNIDALIELEINIPFDLSVAPLIRFKLYNLDQNRHVLIICMHHIISDGWSTEVLNKELFNYYNDYANDQVPNAPKLSTQYIDFALWQHTWLDQVRLDQQLSYWHNKLQGIPKSLGLQCDFTRPKQLTYNGNVLQIQLPLALQSKLHELAEMQNCTMFMLMLSIFKVFLYVYSGQNDIVVGSPVANRHYPNVDGIIGFFVNTLVLRSQIDSTSTISDIIQQVKFNTLEAYQHQDIPFEQLVDKLKIERDLNHSAIFQVMFTMLNTIEQKSLHLDGASVTTRDFNYKLSKFDLSLTAIEEQNCIKLYFEYATDLFTSETINRMANNFLCLLNDVVNNSNKQVFDLNTIAKEEQEKLLVAWNNNSRIPIHVKNIQHLFEQQAALLPDRIAVVFMDQQISYKYLNSKANQLARHLQELGVGPDVLVAIAMQRSIDMMISILAVLKAGGAYVPLDPTYPSARLNYILNDTETQILISHDKAIPDLQPIFNEYQGSVINIDQLEYILNEIDNSNLPHIAKPYNLAYIIYTSGSTGQPKGVMIQHNNVIRLFACTKDLFFFTKEDTWSMFHSHMFDFSVWEIWGAMLYGGKLVIVPYFEAIQPHAFKDLIIKQHITVLNQTPSAFSVLIKKYNLQDTKIRFVIFGGEEFILNKIAPYIPKLDESRFAIINMYGITETTVHTTFRIYNENTPKNKSLIGQQLKDLKLYILNSDLNLVPIGAIGEIFIAGSGLAKGYLNNPSLTAQRFIPNPFATPADLEQHSNLRLYRTGDLARYMPDGDIEYIGRNDHQVKIRGFRIELGEIENSLLKNIHIDNAVIVAKEDPDGDKYLIAYVSVQKNSNIAHLTLTHELRNYLLNILPSYMIPSYFVCLDQLPLTKNGKIDKHALPMPNIKGRSLDDPYTPPSNQIEQTLCDIWMHILNKEQIGIHDNYFALGGHSLLAIKIFSRITEKLNIELPLKSIFITPTIFGLSQSIFELLKINVTSSIIIPKVKRAQFIPLSFAQQRLWFLHQLLDNKALYNVPLIFEINGPLNYLALEQAINYLIQRHESLRTEFKIHNGAPYQFVNPQLNVRITVEKATIHNVDNLIELEISTPFDLNLAPLIRFKLYNLESNNNVLIICMHHIISDGWSNDILCRELSNYYYAYVNNHIPEITNLPIQYIDFALWQHTWLDQEKLDQQLAYWQNKLDEMPKLLNLATDFVRPKHLTYGGDVLQIQLPHDLQNRLHKLAEQQNCTMFMLMLSAFKLLLYAYSGQNDIVVGTPVANRHYPNVEEVIGSFVNTLVLRTRINSTNTINDIIQQIKNDTLEAYQHQDIPFEYLVDKLAVERDLNHNPIFQIMFTMLNNLEYQDLQLHGLQVAAKDFKQKISKFDLSLTAIEQHDHITIRFEYATDLFASKTISNMANNFVHLLNDLVNNPSKQIFELEAIAPEEAHKILSFWNNTSTLPFIVKNVQDLFEQQAALNPDRTAITFNSQYISYEHFNAKANQMARYLQELGVGPDVLVAIAMERSIDMILSIFAVLKAGGAYVPIDPTYPATRLQYIINDTKTQILVIHDQVVTDLKPVLNEYCGTAINFNQIDSILYSKSTDNLPHIVNPYNLAYIIYTSGSTGQPKGVMIQHNGLMNYVYSSINAYTQNRKTVAFHSSFAFDMSITTTLLPFCAGLTLHINEFKNIFENEPNIIKLTPTHLKILDQIKTRPDNHDYKPCFIVGGESLNIEDMHNISKLFKEYSIFNEYGPTEITVACTIFNAKNYNTSNQLLVPIGRPIDNTKIYILNNDLNCVPTGVTGEIYIGGMGLARGYLNKPALTAERFIPNPFATKDDLLNVCNLRLYRSGDLARYLPDGTLEYLGRSDEQVKIRGFRIEPGEISSALMSHSAVKTATVIIHPDNTNKELVAYITTDTATNSLEKELRSYLNKTLPDYMIPRYFVFLNNLPLTQNGKIDKRALPLPSIEQRTLNNLYADPYNKMQQMLCEIWMQIMNKKQIGIHDNYFALGGHSLLAIKIISRIRDEFKVDLPLKLLFTHPTIAELSHALTETLNANAYASIYIPKAGRNKLIPLSFAQQRLWFLNQLLDNKSLYNIPLVFEINGSINCTALEQAINYLIRRHESLRTCFKLTDGEPHQFVVQHIDPLLTIKTVREQEIDSLVALEINTPFDLSSAPLIRFKLYNLDQNKHVLIICMHHIISDGWSIEVLCSELSDYYNIYVNNEIPVLPKLPIQYIDFTLWQQQWLNQEKLKSQLAYWQNKLHALPKSLDLAYDFARPTQLSYEGDVLKIQLPNDLQDKLHELSEQQNCTMFMLMLSVFKLFLHAYSGQNDIVVGSPVANRHYPDVSGIIGFFVNTLVLRTYIDPIATINDVIQQIKINTLEAYQHQDIPFEQLVDNLQIDRDLNHNAIFQVMFIMHSYSEQQTLKLRELNTKIKDFSYSMSKFDLSLAVVEQPDQMQLCFEYATDLFTRDTIYRMANNFVHILKEIVNNCNKKVLDLEMVAIYEKQKLFNFNNTSIAPHNAKNVIDLFEQQARLYPDRTALIFNKQHISFEYLNNKSNQIARYLQELGIGPDMLVAIAMERSIDLFITIFAVLKAGGAYVPLDPSYPATRLKYILNDTKAPILVTHNQVITDIEPVLNAYSGLSININQISSILNSKSNNNLLHIVRPYNLVYVIYTSGSTGQPKGVMVQHDGLINTIIAQNKSFGVVKSSKLVQFASFAFDASASEIFTTLTVGASLLITDPSIIKEPDLLINLINMHHATTITLPPSYVHHFPVDKFKIDTLITAGEMRGDIKHVLAKSENCINAYGPTEASICATILEDSHNSRSGDVGYPINNTKIYIINKYLQICPIGVPGEICIAGNGLARGYLNNPKITAEKFIPNPFDTDFLRLYRTGDLGLYNENGTIEFIGRIDHQVKIRGIRIELSEIELAILQFPLIQHAIVHVESDNTGHKSLCSYIVLKTSHEDNKNILLEIIDFLKSMLPQHMIPSKFKFIDKIPLTINGKIDYKELEKSKELFSPNNLPIPPRNDMQKQMCKIWSTVLGLPIEKIGIRDDFFHLGGDSILSIRLIYQIKKIMNININVKDIFLHKNIETILTKCRNREDVYIKKNITNANIPFLPIQKWFFSNNFKIMHHWNQSFIIKTPPLNITKLDECILKLVEHFSTFNLRFKKEDNKYKQFYNTDTHNITLKTLDISSEGKVLEDILTVWQSHFDLESGPLCSFGYIYGFGDNSARIHIALHHLIVDGISCRIIMDALYDLYHDIDLGAPSSNYSDWVLAMEKYPLIYPDELRFWHNCLAGVEKTQQLSNIYSTLDEPLNIIRHLNEHETKRLLSFVANSKRFEINDVMLSALAIALEEITLQKTNYVLLEGHGRQDIFNNIDITNMIGWCTSIFPIRLDSHETVNETLLYTKQALSQIPNKGLGFGSFVNFDNCKLPQISFNYMGQFNQSDLSNENTWLMIDEFSGTSVHPLNNLPNVLTINCIIVNKQLVFNIQSKLESVLSNKFIDSYISTLLNIVSSSTEQDSTKYLMSDFIEFDPYIYFAAKNNSNSEIKSLFILPPANGGAETYIKNIVQHLDNFNLTLFNNFYLYMSENHGQASTKKLSYYHLAKQHISWMRSIQSHGPYNIFGWSFGAILTFEIARQLQESGDVVENIFLIDPFFDYKSALNDTNTHLTDINIINYDYTPKCDLKSWHTNIVLFKALQYENENENENENTIFKQYALHAPYNNLNKILDIEFLLNSDKLLIVQMDSSHGDWIVNDKILSEICQHVVNKMQNHHSSTYRKEYAET